MTVGDDTGSHVLAGRPAAPGHARAPSPTRTPPRTPSPGRPQSTAMRSELASVPTDERNAAEWRTIQDTLLARHEAELTRLHREVAALRDARAHVPATVAEQPAGALASLRKAGNKHLSTHSNALFSRKSNRLPDVHVYSDAGDEAPWRPYEKAYAENAVLMPWVPRKFYQFRWAIMNHSPFVRRFWRGQYTVGELIVTLLIIAQMLWITMHWAIDTDGFRRDIKRTGHVASVLLMTVYIIAIHNNSVFLLALGLPFDRALPWHKMLAFSSIYNSLIHGLAFYLAGRADSMPKDAYTDHHIISRVTKAYGMEITGWSLLASMVSMSLLAVPWVARRCFTVFYRTHVVFALLTGILALFHGFGSAAWSGYAPASIPGALFWFGDLIIRFFFMNCLTTTKKAKLRIIAPPGDDERAPVVEFSVPNTRRKYTAGQWVFICIPKLGLLHWHPFTISSASLDADLTLHFICEGKWTREVAALARDNTEMKAYVEGPYGAPMIDTHGPRYKCFLIISSGMGWTFLRAWKRQLLQDASRGRGVRAITSVAIMRHHDRYLAPEFTGWHCGIDEQSLDEEEVYLTGKPSDPPDLPDPEDPEDIGANPNPLRRELSMTGPLFRLSATLSHARSGIDRRGPASHLSNRLERAAEYAGSVTSEGAGLSQSIVGGTAQSNRLSVDLQVWPHADPATQASPRIGDTANLHEAYALACRTDVGSLTAMGSRLQHRHAGAARRSFSGSSRRNSLNLPDRVPEHSDVVFETAPSSAVGGDSGTPVRQPLSPLSSHTAARHAAGPYVPPHAATSPLDSDGARCMPSAFTAPPVTAPDAFGSHDAATRDAALARLRGNAAVEPFVHYKMGRPDLALVFREAAEQARAMGERRVAIMICGNDHVLDACLAEVQRRQGTQVEFDVHFEAFGF